MSGFTLPKRRRIYLMRHGDVTYFDASGRAIDPESVPLNANGRVQATAAGDLFAAQGIRFDRVIVSGLPRTLETARRVLAQTGQSGGTFFACEHRHLCGQTQKACSACGNGLPVKKPTDPNNLICSCGAAFPACPECTDGWLVERRGRNGKFLGCVNYPACTGTQNLPDRAFYRKRT